MPSEESTAVFSTESSLISPEAAVQTPAEYRPGQVERALFGIQSEQNLVLGTFAGVIAGAVGAAVCTVVTVATMFQIGWLAVGTGFLVGAAVRWAGRGTTQAFGVVGAAIALTSVLAGIFFSILGLHAGALGIS